MAEFDSQRVYIAEQLRRGLATENRLSPDQARAFVRGLQVTWNVPTIQWDASESAKVLTDAQRLLHAAEILSDIEGTGSTSAKDCYRRAAELFEWLTRGNHEAISLSHISLLAAAAFQLGGMPAMATALLGQIDSPDAGIRLMSKFLQGDFNGVLESVLSFWKKNPGLVRQGASMELLNSDVEGDLQWYFTVEMVRSIGLLASTLRGGDFERMQQALLKLKSLDKMATRTFGDEISMLISLLVAVAESYGETSIYRPLFKLALKRPDRKERLQRFARDQFGRGRGILWPSQLRGLERLLKNSSFALCTPTGSGKTLVANLALVKELMLAPDSEVAPLALYLVPSRALAGEVEAKLVSELGQDMVITGLYGGSDWGITDYWLNSDMPTVLIATVEKADALMRYVGPLITARLKLLIIDEAHQVVVSDRDRAMVDFAEHSNRSIRLESFVSRLLARIPNIARIALTAVAEGASLPVARWIEGNPDAQPIGTSYRSTRQLIGTLEATPLTAGQMQIDMMNGAILHVRGRKDPVYIPLRIPIMPRLPTGMRNSIYRYNQINVLWTALHLIEGERRVLISVAQQPEKTMKWFMEALEQPEWDYVSKFEAPTDPTLRALFSEARSACLDYCGEESYEVALLDHGIATSHGQMPQRVRRLMIELIERRICPVTVATATLTEGVNLPFDLIFVPALTRQTFDRSIQRSTVSPLSTAEFRNLAGRAGRPGATEGMEGITLVAIPTHPSATGKMAVATQQRQIRDMRMHYSVLLKALSAEEDASSLVLSPLALLLQTLAAQAQAIFGVNADRFLAWLETTAPTEISDSVGMAQVDHKARLADGLDELDGILLTAIEELAIAGESLDTNANTEALLQRVWQHSFSNAIAVQEAWLERAFVRRGQAVANTLYSDADERRRLYLYGFSPSIGRRFELIAPKIRSVLESSENYVLLDPKARLAVFRSLGKLVALDQGFGFRGRGTIGDEELLNDWLVPLAWWMRAPQAESPNPEDLRGWQRFVSENFEFRLGVAVGAVVAQIWGDAEDGITVPSLETWKETTGLPWFGFWVRELLRWGTLDPFVAFSLSQGLAGTRDEASARRQEFEVWMEAHHELIEAEDWIDPQYFLQWQRSQTRPKNSSPKWENIPVQLDGTDGRRGKYSVLPMNSKGRIFWIDAAGYKLAEAASVERVGKQSLREDFELKKLDGFWQVQRVF